MFANMKAQYIKTAQCHHCNKDFQIARSDQKFCSTSHRAANHSLKKRRVGELTKKNETTLRNLLAVLETTPLPANQVTVIENSLVPTNQVSGQDDYKSSFLKDTLSSALALAINEFIKTLKEVNNSNIMEGVKNNQAELIKLNEGLTALKEQIELMNSKKDSDNSSPPHLFLQN